MSTPENTYRKPMLGDLIEMPIVGAYAVAALIPAESKAPFNRAALIVHFDNWSHLPNCRLKVTGYEGSRVKGDVLTAEELAVLIGSGQALYLPRAPLLYGAELWRGKLSLSPPPFYQDFVLSTCKTADGWLYIVDGTDPGATEWLAGAASRALHEARCLAIVDGAWEQALAQAELAQACTPGLDAKGLGVLAVLYARCDRTARATGIVTMARRSRGDDFAAQVEAAISLFTQMLDLC